MESTLKHIQVISLLFLIPIGLIHLASGALFTGNALWQNAEMIFKITYLPFLITAVTYSMTSLKINLDAVMHEHNPVIDYVLIGIGSVAILALSLLNFLLPNS